MSRAIALMISVCLFITMTAAVPRPISQLNSHFFLDSAWINNMSGDVVQLNERFVVRNQFIQKLYLCACIAWATQARKPIATTTADISTFATVVGHPKTPTSAGNGGLSLGLPCLPSKDSIKALQNYKKLKNLNSFFAANIGTGSSVHKHIK
uniref:Uncharacterized protein n=1 Tax=Strigamia maritima TaxID=126957 RepID=T1JA63_STRMM